MDSTAPNSSFVGSLSVDVESIAHSAPAPQPLDHPQVPDATWTVSTQLPVSFVVKTCNNLFGVSNREILEFGTQGEGARRLIVIDSTVYALYGDAITEYFDHHKIAHRIVPITANESDKDLDTLITIMREMEEFGIMRRDEPLIAIGGGVLLDVAGLAASLYRRGIPYIRVPTTLLGLVDASVGAKVAVNCFGRRNRMGAYYPPIASYLDRSFLTTLAEGELSNGLAEILKMAVVKNAHLFSLIERYGEALIRSKFQHGEVATEIINLSIKDMIEELEPNLWEKDLERLVDFGHSFSPIIEMRALPELSHGQAVALDILFSCILSHQRGYLSASELERIFRTTRALGLPLFHPMFGDADILEESLQDTMRHRNGAQNLPLPMTIGESRFVNDVTREEIERAAATMRVYSQALP